MTNPVAVLRHTTRADTGEYLGARLLLWCPGCFAAKGFGPHQVWVPGREVFRASTCWDWDGNIEVPTITPSLPLHRSLDGLPSSATEVAARSDQPAREQSRPGSATLHQ